MGDWYRKMGLFVAVILAPVMVACSPQQDQASLGWGFAEATSARALPDFEDSSNFV